MPAANTVNLSDQLANVIARCRASAAACVRCTEAMAASGRTDTFRAWMRVCSDCADVCRTTAQVASRHAGGDSAALSALLRACAKACAESAASARAHDEFGAAECVLVSLNCKEACERLASALRWR